MDTMASIRQTFFQECDEQLIELEYGLLAIQQGDGNGETVNAVFRAVHSIKGGAGAFELADIVHFAHVFENTLDLVRTGRLEPHPALMKVMLRATDILSDLITAGREGRVVDLAKSEGIAVELASHASVVGDVVVNDDEPFVFEPIAVESMDLMDFDAMPALATERAYAIRFSPQAALYAKGNDATVLFRELDKLGRLSVECNASRLPPLGDLDASEAYFEWTLRLVTDADETAIAEIFDFVSWDSELSIESLPAEIGDQDPLGESAEDFDIATFAPEIIDASDPQEAAGSGAATPSGEPSADVQKTAAAPATIRVDLDRVDRLIDLVGELVINQAMLNERVEELHLPRMSPVLIGLDELEQLTREI